MSEDGEREAAGEGGREAAAVGSPTGMRFMAAAMRLLPAWLVYFFAWFPVLWYFVVRPEGRSSSAVYQRMLGRRVGPVRRFLFGLSQARAYSHVILDNLYLGIFGPGRFALRELGTDVFRASLEAGKGLVLLSSHVGNWHLAVNFMHNTGTRVHLVIDDVRQEEVRRQMDAAKAQSTHLTVHGTAGGADLIFELKAALGRGEVVVMAGDRGGGRRRARVPFLGGEAWFPTSGFSLAAATGAPVCTALNFRTGMHAYDCHGIGPFEAGGGRPARELAAEFAAQLGVYLERHPEQWFNFYDFWDSGR